MNAVKVQPCRYIQAKKKHKLCTLLNSVEKWVRLMFGCAVVLIGKASDILGALKCRAHEHK